IPIIFDEKVYGIINLDFYKRFKRLNRTEKKIIELLISDLPIIINHIFNLRDLVLDSYKDILTGVYNRKILNEEVLKDYKYFFFIDINKFKQINDKYGHLIGDEVLKIVAKRLVHIFAEDDIVIRYGGDEFLVCLKSDSDFLTEDIKNRIKSSLSQDIVLRDKRIKLSVSVGAFVKKEDEPLNSIIEKVDKLMYKDKNGI
ncbi:MAG: GGDEF domain-containing protein, partial [Thermotogaceae bacterium]|nr:GGDEF domain-containing protein [Thermotogaceae bacterium]